MLRHYKEQEYDREKKALHKMKIKFLQKPT